MATTGTELENSQNSQNQLRKGKYDITTYAYPVDVGFSDETQHYVEFYINVRQDSAFEKDNRIPELAGSAALGYVNGAQLSEAEKKQLALNLSKVGQAGGTVIAGTGAARGDLTQTIVGVSSAAVSGTVERTLQGEKTFLSDTLTDSQPVRISDVIRLHMQEPPSVRYNVNYSDFEIGAIGGFLSQVSDVTKVLENQNNLGGEAATRAMLAVAAIPSAIAGAGSLVQGTLGATFRKKTNPFREVLFESVDYRTFSFRYRFMPKNPQEARAAKNIMDKFKLHMLPEISPNKFFFTYPSEFQIKYMYRGKENEYLNKITQCALIDMQVEYGGEKFSTFDDGVPVETILTLTFRELALLTKAEAILGY